MNREGRGWETVGLLDVDSKPGYPDLALMKISTWAKERGCSVHLSKHRISSRHHRLRLQFAFDFPRGDLTLSFVSTIFEWHRPEALLLGSSLPGRVFYGGPGFRPGPDGTPLACPHPSLACDEPTNVVVVA